MSLSAGARVGPYEVLGLLGAGGMGEVYRARDARLARDVAIKILPETFSQDAERVSRFEQEARAAGVLNHPNILAVHDVGVHEGRSYVVSELLEGQTLGDRIGGRPLPLRKAVEYGVQIAHGLATAHDRGIVHRDLKPDNVFVTSEGRVKILDFGVAKQLGPVGDDEATARRPDTEAGAVIGTVGYMSPEQVLAKPVDHRSDLFSLGVILYEMLSGRRAFQKASAVETMHAVLKEDPPDLAEVVPGIPAAVVRIARRCLEKDRGQRFQSARDLGFALEALSLDAPGRPPPERPRGGRLRRIQLGLALAGAASLGAGMRALMGRPGPVLDSYRFSPLATAAGYEGAASWSPDGASVAYVAEADGVLQVFTRSLQSSMSAQITRSLADCHDPFWSADGTRLFYISLAGSSLGLWSVGATGGTPQIVVRNASAAALSPDGRTLALLREENQQGSFSLSLWTSAPVGSEPVRYADPALAARRFGRGFLHFSPDGKKLGLWVAPTSGDTRGEQGYASPELWILPQPNGPARQALAALSVMPDPAPFNWMPDSRRIVFGGQFLTRTPGTHIWMADTETGELRSVTTSSGNEQYPAVSPDGRRIAYTDAAEDYDLIAIPLDGSTVRTELSTARTEADPAWSPAGGQYAYVTDRTGNPEIWLRSVDGSFERPIVTGASFRDPRTLLLTNLAFAPDGQRFAYQRRSVEGFNVWTSTVAGGTAVRLTQSEGYEDTPTWSPDGNWVAFTWLRGGSRALAKVGAGGGESPVTIKEGIIYPSDPHWSPRGDWITCELPDGFALVSPDGERTRVLADESWLAHAWSRDGTTIFAVRHAEEPRLELIAVDVVTGRVRTLAQDLGPAPPSSMPLRGLSLGPDGRSLLSSIYRLRGDVWLLEGFDAPRGLFERPGASR
jgi:Tol biopolymer transport system component